MKKLLMKTGELFVSLFAVVIAIPLGICVLLYLPFDYIKYIRSPYYKKERKRYEAFAGTGEHFALYNEIIRNDLPIRYIYHPEDDTLAFGWFVYQKTLIIPNLFSFSFDEETGQWVDITEDDDGVPRTIMSLDDFLAGSIQDANELSGSRFCEDAIVLIDADDIECLERARTEKRFLLYEGDRVEALRQFCEKALSE